MNFEEIELPKPIYKSAYVNTIQNLSKYEQDY